MTLQKTILITGASSGIGKATCIALAQPGIIFILTGRNAERLSAVKKDVEIHGAQAFILLADLANPVERKFFFEQADGVCDCPDIVINNAGYGWMGYFHQMPLEIASDMNELMINTVVEIDRYYLLKMITRGSGHIIHVGSMVGGMPNNGIAVYSAVKAYLDNFCTCLYRETRGTGVNISIVRPGPVKSEFFDKAKTQENGKPIPGESMAIPPERVAKIIVRLIKHPRRERYVPGIYWITKFWEPFMGWFVDLLGPILLK